MPGPLLGYMTETINQAFGIRDDLGTEFRLGMPVNEHDHFRQPELTEGSPMLTESGVLCFPALSVPSL